jgi:hypothetical protein
MTSHELIDQIRQSGGWIGLRKDPRRKNRPYLCVLASRSALKKIAGATGLISAALVTPSEEFNGEVGWGRGGAGPFAESLLKAALKLASQVVLLAENDALATRPSPTHRWAVFELTEFIPERIKWP